MSDDNVTFVRGIPIADLPREFGYDPDVPERLKEIYVKTPFAAEVTGAEISTVQRHLRQGKLEGDKIGRDWFILREALRWWNPGIPGRPAVEDDEDTEDK